METEFGLGGGGRPQRVRGADEKRRGQVRVLIADDSPFVVRGLGFFFKQREGFTVVRSAANGQEALDRVAALRPDLVVMDLRMPVMDGLEATRRIKGRKGAPVVILLTLEDGQGYRERAKAAGADDYVAKAPKMYGNLGSAIRRAFPGPKAVVEAGIGEDC